MSSDEAEGDDADREALVQRVAALEGQVAALEDFAARIAHDVLGPARRISAFAQLLGRDANGDRDADGDEELLGFLVDASARLSDVVSSLSALAEAGVPRQERPGPSDLRAAIADVIAASAIEVATTDLPDATSIPSVDAPPSTLAEIVRDLLVVARSRQRRVAPSIAVSSDDHHVTLRVTDDGVAVSSDDGADLDVIRPFAPTGTPVATMPLRWAAAARRVATLGGSCRVASSDQGTTIAVRLPIAPRDA